MSLDEELTYCTTREVGIIIIVDVTKNKPSMLPPPLPTPMFKDRTSLPGIWLPSHGNVTCTGKGVKIKSTNQWVRISSSDDFIG